MRSLSSRLDLDQVGGLGDERPLLGEVVQRVHADEGLEAAHAGADGRLARHGERADLGVLHVGATAQPRATRGRRSRRHAPLAVGLAEERARPTRGPRAGSCTARRRAGPADREVGDLLDLAAGLRREGLVPREVEPQVAGLVVGAGLQRRRAEHLAQRRVDDVGPRVRLAGGDAPLWSTSEITSAPARTGPCCDLDGVRDEALDGPLDVEDLQVCARRR